MQITAQGCIPADHPALAGHFPGNPIVPGVLLLNEVLSVIERGLRVTPGPLSFSIVKFTAPLRPGELFTVTVDAADRERISFTIRRGNAAIASGSLQHRDALVATVTS
jgi:3-hydroxymyristoyl/3-hydroxydecanoyl-(acyl carrier protein) dehydratase